MSEKESKCTNVCVWVKIVCFVNMSVTIEFSDNGHGCDN